MKTKPKPVTVWLVEYRHLDAADLEWRPFSAHLQRSSTWQDMAFWRGRVDNRRELFRTRRAVAS